MVPFGDHRGAKIMDRQFLEFWGKSILAAAKGQEQLEDLSNWIRGLGAGSENWTALFRQTYGLEPETSDSKAWDQAMKQFQSSLKSWLFLMNLVPSGELEALQKKCQALEQKVAAQQGTIRHLQQLAGEKSIPVSDAVLNFSRLMEQQSRQFEELMGSVGKAFSKETDSS